LIPLLNLVVLIMFWVNVLNSLGRDPIIVVLVLFVAFIYIPILAFSSEKRAVPATV